jgi:hypothetical protein
LYWLCANLAERKPLLLTVDDLHWVDGPSLSWLAYLGPRCAESAMLVVLTVREGDPRGRANSVAAAADDSSVHRMGLSALSVASVAALVRAELGPTASAGFCSACWELAGGNPLYVRELLAAARNERLSGADDDVTALRALASSAVGASVLGRLARLGSDAVSLAQALAVLGSQTEVGVAAELAGLDPAAAELTADRLVAAQILGAARARAARLLPPADRRGRLRGPGAGRPAARTGGRPRFLTGPVQPWSPPTCSRPECGRLTRGVQRLSAAADTAGSAARPKSPRAISGALAEPATPGNVRAPAAPGCRGMGGRRPDAVTHLKGAERGA